MEFFKKFNQYMLENHPMAWHSKIIQLLIAGLLFFVVSFAYGYLHVDLSILKTDYLGSLYFSSNFFSFHIIFCLIVICIWAISFYKNNALKSFYPLQRFYLIRLFLQLMLGFGVLILAYFPFQMGANQKTRSILNAVELKVAISQLNLGYPFLVAATGQYEFNNNLKIKSNDLSYFYYDNKDESWSRSYGTYYIPEALNKKYYSPFGDESYVPNDNAYTSLIDGRKFLFYKSIDKYTNADSCTSNQFITHFQKIDGLHYSDLLNYSDPYAYNKGVDFNAKLLPRIYSWVNQQQHDSIVRAIDKFTEVCDKYGIANNINAPLFVKYLKLKQYRDLSVNILKGSNVNYSDLRGKDNYYSDFGKLYPEYMQIIEEYNTNALGDVMDSDAEVFVKAMEKQDLFYYNDYELNQLLQNYYQSNVIYYSSFIGLLMGAFALATFFIWFEFTEIKSLLISIPVAGVLSMIIGVFIAFSYNYFVGNSERGIEKFGLTIVLVVELIILALTIYGIYNQSFNKKLLNVLVNLSYMVVLNILALILQWINLMSGHYVFQHCSERYTYLLSPLFSPEMILLYAAIGLFTYFYFIKKWRAREE